MNAWIGQLVKLDEPAVLVTVAGTRGSAPRETGAKMIVTRTETIGTIGGGQLEYECARTACTMFDGCPSTLRRFPLGASMGQCCGGVVDVLFEPLGVECATWLSELSALCRRREAAVLCTHVAGEFEKHIVTADGVVSADTLPPDVAAAAGDLLAERCLAGRSGGWLLEPIRESGFNIAVFGAGHVGTAVVRALAPLDCHIRWIDNRRDMFVSSPPNVRIVEAFEPAREVAALPPGSCFLVMTHSHPLDYEICAAVLRRRDAAYCGLIGSRSKRRRFEKRFRSQGMPEAWLRELVCPIGIDGISGKKPADIAVAVAAEVLRANEGRQRGGKEESDGKLRLVDGKGPRS